MKNVKDLPCLFWVFHSCCSLIALTYSRILCGSVVLQCDALLGSFLKLDPEPQKQKGENPDKSFDQGTK